MRRPPAGSGPCRRSRSPPGCPACAATRDSVPITSSASTPGTVRTGQPSSFTTSVDRLDLLAQGVGHRRAVGLVVGVPLVPEGRAGRVEDAGGVVGPHLARSACSMLIMPRMAPVAGLPLSPGTRAGRASHGTRGRGSWTRPRAAAFSCRSSGILPCRAAPRTGRETGLQPALSGPDARPTILPWLPPCLYSAWHARAGLRRARRLRRCQNPQPTAPAPAQAQPSPTSAAGRQGTDDRAHPRRRRRRHASTSSAYGGQTQKHHGQAQEQQGPALPGPAGNTEARIPTQGQADASAGEGGRAGLAERLQVLTAQWRYSRKSDSTERRRARPARSAWAP